MVLTLCWDVKGKNDLWFSMLCKHAASLMEAARWWGSSVDIMGGWEKKGKDIAGRKYTQRTEGGRQQRNLMWDPFPLSGKSLVSVMENTYIWICVVPQYRITDWNLFSQRGKSCWWKREGVRKKCGKHLIYLVHKKCHFSVSSHFS